MSLHGLFALIAEGLLLMVEVKVGTQGRIEVLCRPVDARTRYGTDELLVTPVNGTGTFWTTTYREADAKEYPATGPHALAA